MQGTFKERFGFAEGSIIEYRPFGGGTRRVEVTLVDFDIKNGRPGFDGRLANDGDASTEQGTVWGYCDQVTRVVA